MAGQMLQTGCSENNRKREEREVCRLVPTNRKKVVPCISVGLGVGVLSYHSLPRAIQPYIRRSVSSRWSLLVAKTLSCDTRKLLPFKRISEKIMAPERSQEANVITNGHHSSTVEKVLNGHVQPLIKHPLPDIDRP